MSNSMININNSILQRHANGIKPEGNKVREFGNLAEQLKAVRAGHKIERR